MAMIEAIKPCVLTPANDQFALLCQTQLATVCQLLRPSRQAVELLGGRT